MLVNVKPIKLLHSKVIFSLGHDRHFEQIKLNVLKGQKGPDNAFTVTRRINTGDRTVEGRGRQRYGRFTEFCEIHAYLD